MPITWKPEDINAISVPYRKEWLTPFIALDGMISSSGHLFWWRSHSVALKQTTATVPSPNHVWITSSRSKKNLEYWGVFIFWPQCISIMVLSSKYRFETFSRLKVAAHRSILMENSWDLGWVIKGHLFILSNTSIKVIIF